VFSLRFDMRAPEFGAPIAELYAAALDMSAWAEEHGCLQLVVSEHHASSDGYLPAPMLLASSMAARTSTVGIQVAALLVPLHDPVELAEQMAVLDIMSGGRVSYVCAIGYRPEEYAMFGREMKRRGARMDESLGVMRRAWAGESFEYEGRPVTVTPRPSSPAGPMLFMGGSSPAAIRRAARFGMGMITQGGAPELEDVYREACASFGNQPGLFIHPPANAPTSVYLAEDVDAAWSTVGPHLLHDARMYGEWMGDAKETASGSVAPTVEALRAENGNYRILNPEQAVAQIQSGMPLLMQPLVGGLPPDLAWRSLELLASKVLPALRAEA